MALQRQKDAQNWTQYYKIEIENSANNNSEVRNLSSTKCNLKLCFVNSSKLDDFGAELKSDLS